MTSFSTTRGARPGSRTPEDGRPEGRAPAAALTDPNDLFADQGRHHTPRPDRRDGDLSTLGELGGTGQGDTAHGYRVDSYGADSYGGDGYGGDGYGGYGGDGYGGDGYGAGVDSPSEFGSRNGVGPRDGAATGDGSWADFTRHDEDLDWEGFASPGNRIADGEPPLAGDDSLGRDDSLGGFASGERPELPSPDDLTRTDRIGRVATPGAPPADAGTGHADTPLCTGPPAPQDAPQVFSHVPGGIGLLGAPPPAADGPDDQDGLLLSQIDLAEDLGAGAALLCGTLDRDGGRAPLLCGEPTDAGSTDAGAAEGEPAEESPDRGLMVAGRGLSYRSVAITAGVLGAAVVASTALILGGHHGSMMPVDARPAGQQSATPPPGAALPAAPPPDPSLNDPTANDPSASNPSASDPAASDPALNNPSTAPQLGGPPPPGLPSGPLPPNQLPGGPPMPYSGPSPDPALDAPPPDPALDAPPPGPGLDATPPDPALNGAPGADPDRQAQQPPVNRTTNRVGRAHKPDSLINRLLGTPSDNSDYSNTNDNNDRGSRRNKDLGSLGGGGPLG